MLNTTRGASLEMLRTEFVPTTNEDGTPRFSDGSGNPIYNASNIWYTSVPDVLCATAIACEAPNPLVKPGAPAVFHVAVRNDGNCYLSGCSLTLCVHNESTDSYERVESATVALRFSADTTQESSWNPRDVDGSLLNVEDDYALGLSKTSVYVVTVSIPKDWTGEKKVLFVARDAIEAADSIVPADTALSVLSDTDSVVSADTVLAAQVGEEVVKVSYAVELGEYRVVQNRTSPDSEYEDGQFHMETLVVEPHAANSTLSPSHATVIDDDGAPGGSGNTPKGSGNTSGGAGSGSSGSVGSSGVRANSASGSVPLTGDDVFPVAVPVGLAAVAAAALAYERRRSENEARGDES